MEKAGKNLVCLLAGRQAVMKRFILHLYLMIKLATAAH